MANVEMQSEVVDRLLDPVAACLTTGVARKIAALRADPATQARLDELADKAAEGDLSVAEREEYATYVEALDFVAMLQVKARALLAASRRS